MICFLYFVSVNVRELRCDSFLSIAEKQKYGLYNLAAYIDENFSKTVLKFSHQFDIPEERLIFEVRMQNLHTKPQIRFTYL